MEKWNFLLELLREYVLVLDYGGGSVLILLLTLFMNLEQHIAQATNLLFFIPAAIVCILFNLKHKNIKLKNAILITTFGIIGSVIGSIISEGLPVNILKKLFGLFLIFICIYEVRSYYILYIKGKKRHNNLNKTFREG